MNSYILVMFLLISLIFFIILYRIKDYGNNIIYVFIVFNFMIFNLLKLNLIYRIMSMLLIIRRLFIFMMFVLINKPFIVKGYRERNKKISFLLVYFILLIIYLLYNTTNINLELFNNYYINYMIDYSYSIVIYSVLLFIILSFLIYNYLNIKI